MNALSVGQSRLVIVGGTGMVCGCALRCALDHLRAVTAIGRSKLGISHPKLKEVLHQDFADYEGLADTLSGQDAPCWLTVAVLGPSPT